MFVHVIQHRYSIHMCVSVYYMHIFTNKYK